MTIEEVQACLDRIRAAAGDPEEAHRIEKALWYRIVDAIAEGRTVSQEAARLALTSTEIEFDRWFA